MAKPTPNTLREIDAALARDDTRIGHVYREKRAGRTNAQIARGVGATSHGWITNYNGYIDSLRTGNVPDGASRRKNTLRAVESFADRHRAALTNEARAWLEQVIQALSRVGDSRPEHNDRDWVAADAGAEGHYQTIQLDGEVYRMLVDRRRPSDRTLNDTLRRLLQG